MAQTLDHCAARAPLPRAWLVTWFPVLFCVCWLVPGRVLLLVLSAFGFDTDLTLSLGATRAPPMTLEDAWGICASITVVWWLIARIGWIRGLRLLFFARTQGLLLSAHLLRLAAEPRPSRAPELVDHLLTHVGLAVQSPTEASWRPVLRLWVHVHLFALGDRAWRAWRACSLDPQLREDLPANLGALGLIASSRPDDVRQTAAHAEEQARAALRTSVHVITLLLILAGLFSVIGCFSDLMRVLGGWPTNVEQALLSLLRMLLGVLVGSAIAHALRQPWTLHLAWRQCAGRLAEAMRNGRDLGQVLRSTGLLTSELAAYPPPPPAPPPSSPPPSPSACS